MISVLHIVYACLETNKKIFLLISGELPFIEIESWDTSPVSVFVLAAFSGNEILFSTAVVTSLSQHVLMQFSSLLTHVRLLL